MRSEAVNKLVLLGLVLIISAVFLTMIHQFIMPLFMAGLFSAVLSPAHHWLTRKLAGNAHIASILTVVGMILLVLVPLSVLIGVVVAQAINVAQSITPFVQTLINEPTILNRYIEKIPYIEQILPYRDVLIEKAGQLVGTVSSFLIDGLSSVANLTISAVFGTIVMLYVMFYFLIMGDVLLGKMLYFLPLRDEDEQLLLRRFTSVTRATIKGTLIIGLLQGLICGLAFAVAGINGSVFWGTVMAAASIIPAFGTALVWVPALVILLLLGDFTGAIILGVLCGLVAGNLDNLIRPRLVGKDTEMHDLFVLFGTLGGIAMFGILGIIIGPIIAALFITIWELYGTAFRDYLPDMRTILRPSLASRQAEDRQPGAKQDDKAEPDNSGGDRGHRD